MFIFDVETLGKTTESVILSMACISFDPDNMPAPGFLKDSAFFVKFDVEHQIKNHKRKIQKSTMEWWTKQCQNTRIKSLVPSYIDVPLDIGHDLFRQWAIKQPGYKKDWIFARGNLDQLILDSIEEQLQVEPVFAHHRWRDVRTAIDFLYGTTNGYCSVDCGDVFDPALHITKHDPVDDCLYDIMMLVYGKPNKESV